MTALAFILIGAALFIYGWWLVGVTDERTTGLIVGALGVFLAAAALFQPATLFGSADVAPIGALILLWSIYALLVAGTGLWDVGGRALGLYSIFVALAMVVYLIYFVGVSFSIAGAVVSAILIVPFLLLFFQEVPPYPQLRTLTGWSFLISGVVTALTGFGVYLGFLA